MENMEKKKHGGEIKMLVFLEKWRGLLLFYFVIKINMDYIEYAWNIQ